MSRSFKDALQHRRSCYEIDATCPLPPEKLQEIVDFALMNVPCAFNSQSTRIVLLLGTHHKKLWDIVAETLKAIVPAEKFAPTKEKIDSFAAGHGTVLFFEDQKTVEGLQKSFPTYAEKFPQWSEHTCGMHQLAVWTMLEDAGLGASLQHYNPLIDDKVRAAWSLDPSWTLVAQMPFGGDKNHPAHPEKLPLDQRRKVFR